MSKESKSPERRDSFTNNLGVLAATAGSAIGLGNIWKFPYEAGANGGAAFMFVYIGFIVLIGVPLLLSELLIGRKSQSNPYGAFGKLAPNTQWKHAGTVGVVTAFVIMAFYGTVAGWSLEYIYQAATDSFTGKTSVEIGTAFESFIAEPVWPLVWQFTFLALTGLVVLGGVKDGIEKYSKLLMPLLLVLILAMIVRSVTLPGAIEGLKFLFVPDFSKLSSHAILSALGHSFFTLSLGMGTLVTYGSYIQRKEHLPKMAINVAIADTGIAILAGMAIFPAVFAFDIDPAAGPGLVFVTLPNVFKQMPGGFFFAISFFVLLAIAALTSAISLLEVIVAYFVEEKKMTRNKATLVGIFGIFAMGVFATYSFSSLKDVTVAGKTIFDILDFSSSRVLLPLGGLAISIFVGWRLKRNDVIDEISSGGTYKIPLVNLYFVILRYIAPVAIVIVFIHGVLAELGVDLTKVFQ